MACAAADSTPGGLAIDQLEGRALTHYSRVHSFFVMKNITLSASEEAIERRRQVARNRKTTLNGLFRNWLEQLGESELREQAFHQQMTRLEGRIRVGHRKLSREEMNER